MESIFSPDETLQFLPCYLRLVPPIDYSEVYLCLSGLCIMKIHECCFSGIRKESYHLKVLCSSLLLLQKYLQIVNSIQMLEVCFSNSYHQTILRIQSA